MNYKEACYYIAAINFIEAPEMLAVIADDILIAGEGIIYADET